MKLENGEKFAFLNLAYFVGNIDGELEKSERDIIAEYCLEMGIENIVFDSEQFDFEENLDKVKSAKSRKIVLLELMMLIHSDDNLHRFEQQIIDKIAVAYNISQNQLNIYSQWGKIASALYIQGKLFLED